MNKEKKNDDLKRVKSIQIGKERAKKAMMQYLEAIKEIGYFDADKTIRDNLIYHNERNTKRFFYYLSEELIGLIQILFIDIDKEQIKKTASIHLEVLKKSKPIFKFQ